MQGIGLVDDRLATCRADEDAEAERRAAAPPR